MLKQLMQIISLLLLLHWCRCISLATSKLTYFFSERNCPLEVSLSIHLPSWCTIILHCSLLTQNASICIIWTHLAMHICKVHKLGKDLWSFILGKIGCCGTLTAECMELKLNISRAVLQVIIYILLLVTPDSIVPSSLSLLCYCCHSLPFAILLFFAVAADTALCCYTAFQSLLQTFHAH